MYLDVMRAVLEALEKGQIGVLCTVLDHKGSAPGKKHHKMLLLQNGKIKGTVGGGSLEANVILRAKKVIAENRSTIESFHMLPKELGGIGAVCGGTVRVVFEMLPKKPHVLICGAGHVGLEIAKTLTQLGYFNEIHDDRKELIENSDFPIETKLHTSPLKDLSEFGGFSRFSHIVLVSRGHETDRIYGKAILNTDYSGWIGMMGSKRKHKMLSKIWKNEDKMPKTQIERIECPVGIKIGGSTPAEIAISIAARIVQTS